MKRIYLDHAATTPLAPEAAEAMRPWLDGEFGNPSSLHLEGRRAKDAIDEARETLAEALGCEFGEVVFTSSGTEAANLAILGTALKNEDPRRNRILLGAAEHHCVLHTKPLLERLGFHVELMPVDREAQVHPEALGSLLGDDVLLVSVMHANNEIGTINPEAELAALTHEVGALFHTDAVQTFLVDSLPRLSNLAADLVSVSAHKVNGPKGVGALYQRAGVKLQPISLGGGQEREVRAGTENVAGIVGFGAAGRARSQGTPAVSDSQRQARDLFLQKLEDAGFVRTAKHFDSVLPGHAHVRLLRVDAETMLIRLDRMGVAASSGAACSSGSLEPSHVLLACGYTKEEAKEGLRFSFPSDADLDEANEAADRVIEAGNAIRSSRA